MKLISNTFNILLLTIVSIFNLQAQISDPVEWSTAVKKINEINYEIIFNAEIEHGWHVYSQNIDGNDGPIPTEFGFLADGLTKEGVTNEPKGIEGFDKTFEMNIKYFEDKASFTQKVIIDDTFKDPVKASVFFMVCNDERCLPPEEKEFEVYLKSSPKTTAIETGTTLTGKDKTLSQQLELPLKKTDQFVISTTKKKTLWKLFFLGFIMVSLFS